jgi:hypothetical protein
MKSERVAAFKSEASVAIVGMQHASVATRRILPVTFDKLLNTV